MRSRDRRSDVRSEEDAQTLTQEQALRMVEMPEVQRNLFVRPLSERTHVRAAFIGTRRIDEVSQFCHATYLDLVERAVNAGHTIRTGGARGADQIAAMRALHLGGHVELVLPWKEYEDVWTWQVRGEFPDQIWMYYGVAPVWDASVDKYHPAPQMLTPRARLLHARNYGIIEPCEVVVALCAPDRKGAPSKASVLRKHLVSGA